MTKVLIRCKEKKRAYNERVILMEKDTFTPTVISTSGGVGIEADRHHKRIASLIARKRRQSYADALRYIRTRLRFCLSKSVLIAITGVRGKRMKENSTPISSLSFNLIDFFFHWNCIFSLQFESYFLSNQPLSLSRSGRNVSWISGMITHCYEKVGHVLWLFSSCNVFYVCLRPGSDAAPLMCRT